MRTLFATVTQHDESTFCGRAGTAARGRELTDPVRMPFADGPNAEPRDLELVAVRHRVQQLGRHAGVRERRQRLRRAPRAARGGDASGIEVVGVDVRDEDRLDAVERVVQGAVRPGSMTKAPQGPSKRM